MTTAPPFDATRFPDRLNLGCGFDHRAGFLNVDLHAFHDPDLVADVTDLAVLPAGRYVEILAQDVLEHLPRIETQAVLGEWNRLLAMDGILTLRIPSLIDLVALMTAPENQEPARQELFMQCLFGTQAYTGDVHLTSFTRPLLSHYFAEEGFEPVRWELYDGWLFDIDVRKVGESRFRERFAPYLGLLAHHDIDEFLDAAYAQIMGREPDASGRHHYGEQLRSGMQTRRSVVQLLVESDEGAAYRAG